MLAKKKSVTESGFVNIFVQTPEDASQKRIL